MNQKGRGRHADALMKPGKYSKQNMFGIQALVEKFAEANLVCSGETHQRRSKIQQGGSFPRGHDSLKITKKCAG